MYRKIRTIEKVFRYSFSGTELLCSFKNEHKSGELKKINLSSGCVVNEIKTKTAQDTLISFNTMLLTKNNRNFGLVLDDSFDIVEEIPDSLRLADNHIVNDYVTVYRDELSNEEFGVYSLSNKKLLWISGDQRNLEIFDNLLFSQDKYLLCRIDILTGNILWKHDFKSIYPNLSENKGRIVLLDVNKSVLIIGLEKLDKLLALSLETGEIKWERTTLPQFYKVAAVENKIHVITASYKCLDLDTGEELDSYDNRSYFDEVGILSQRNNYCFDGAYIITTDYQKGIIGAFNTEKHKFDWVHKEEGVSFPSPNPILYNEPYLLVHDNRGTLHIFEKE